MTELTESENARLKELTNFLNHCPCTEGDAEMAEFDTLMAKKYDVEDARILYIGNT